MLTRRSFLWFLAAVPVLGRLVPECKPKPLTFTVGEPIAVRWQNYTYRYTSLDRDEAIALIKRAENFHEFSSPESPPHA
jgi:hypothetical protein